ncbi:MAG: gliding motility-associated C-terminal domain-containing protein, partial [Cytophagaceae bacterium]
LCKAYSDVMTITIYPAPVASVNAGLDQTVCKDVVGVHLNGAVVNAGGGIWTTAGTGTFSDPNDLAAVYTPSAADKAAGTITLTLTTTQNGFCNPVSDDMFITVTPAPTASIVPLSNVCADVVGVTLSGSVTVATGGAWTTGGSGVFTPDATTLGGVYVPSVADRNLGSVGLTLTTTGNGTCNPVSATVILTITKKPTVNAGVDKSVCADATAVPVTGSVTVASGGHWTTSGTGTFSPNANTLAVTYIPSVADIASTVVDLTLTTTGNGTCNPVSDLMKISFTPAPTVNAGVDKTVCADVTNIALNGSVTVASGGVWSSAGSGTFSPGANNLTASYVPSGADKTAGSVTLTLTSSGNGTCNAVTDAVIFTILPAPTANTGLATTCAYTNGAPLNGTVANAGGGAWTSSSGTGLFAPNAFTLNATYYPSSTDIANGQVQLTLTTTGNGTCIPVTSTATLIVSPLPNADAGNDQFVCKGATATLIAKTVPNVTYEWFTMTGTSISTNTAVTITANTDTSFVLMLTDPKGCVNRDTVSVKAIVPPTLNLPDHFCFSNGMVISPMATNLPNIPGQYQWYKSNVIMPGQNDSLLVVKSAGKYKVEFAFGSCSTFDTTTITLPPVLIPSPKKITCVGSPVTLQTTNLGGVTYAWALNGSNLGPGNPITVVTVVDTNFYQVTATDGLGCPTKDSIMVIGIAKPILNLSDSSSCAGLSVPLSGRPINIVNIDSLPAVYQWKLNGAPQASTNDTLITTSNGLYKVTVTIDQCSSSDSANISFNPIPAKFLVSTAQFCMDRNITDTLDAGPGVKYLWMPGNDTTRTTVVTAPGIYSVTVFNNFNCSRTDSVNLMDVCEPQVFVPNVFTPDGNGKDDVFGVFGNHYANLKLTIFNRWGEIIFVGDGSTGWDGTYRGEPMPIGEYPWIVTYRGDTDFFPGPYKMEGSVLILK